MRAWALLLETERLGRKIADSELAAEQPGLASQLRAPSTSSTRPPLPAKFMPALGRIIGALLIYLLALSAVSAGNTHRPTSRPPKPHAPHNQRTSCVEPAAHQPN